MYIRASKGAIAGVVLCLVLLPFLLIASASAEDATIDYAAMAKTRWVHPADRPPFSYHQWLSAHPVVESFTAQPVQLSPQSTGPADGSDILICVNQSLYPQIQTSLDQYTADLTAEGYTVTAYTTEGGTPEDFRSFLQGQYGAGMDGCLLIGDLPVPWFEAYWPDDSTYEEFPCDLYYMDINGIFLDTDFNGRYDSHTGNVTPEIWLGRLTASPLTMDGANEVTLLENYFTKNHLYRTGEMPLNQRALVYIDDDWVPWSTTWDENVGEAYDDRVFYNDEWMTFDAHYKARLPESYEFIQVCVHSWPGGHAFHRPGDLWGYAYNTEIVQIDPVAYFYNLFACSNSRYVETDYMGGWYIFCDSYGLASLGSTKSGSMLVFEEFYGPFGEGKTIGASFRLWFAALAANGFDAWEINWHYGMTLCGDPTLRSFDCTGFCDLDANGELNPLDVSYLVNYVYKDLDARAVMDRCPRENGDWDCDGQVNPVDVSFYVNFVFKSLGDGPCDPCSP